MSSTHPAGPTPEKVAALATQSVRLPRRALIGIFGSAERPSALVRNRRGGIHRVNVGDRIDGDTVAAIGSDNIVIARRGRTEVLRIPAG